MSRCASAWSSDWVSCWPCRSTSSAPSSASTAAVVGLPFTQARDRPSAETSRRTTSRPSSRSRPSASIARRSDPVDVLEHALDDRRGAPGPDRSARRPARRAAGERVDEHRLARPGLAGQHVEAGAELQGDVGDGGEVPDPELGDHRRGSRARRDRPSAASARIRREEAVPAEPDEAHAVVGTPHVDAVARCRAWCRSGRRTRPAGRRPSPRIGSITMTVVGRHDERTDGERVRADRRHAPSPRRPGTTIGPPAQSE